jgi:hypothetical protein
VTEPKKKLYETPIGSFLRSLLHAIHPGMPILVCMSCIREGDEIVGEAGDFSVCDRCTRSITSKTGLSVKRREA